MKNNNGFTKEVINNIKEIAGMKQHIKDTCSKHKEFEINHGKEHIKLNETLVRMDNNIERLNRFEFKVIFISAVFGTVAGVISSFWKQIWGK